MNDNKYFWYKRGGFVLAVDAMSHQDAAQYVKLHYGEMEYQGHYEAPRTYTTACCGTTARRQEQISANLAVML